MRIIGHRGYPARYPENTVASLLAALLAGADGVEFDVRLSRDGVPVLLHDETTARVAPGEPCLRSSEAGADALTRTRLGMGQCVPTLREAVEAVPPGYLLLVEVKEEAAAEPSYRVVAAAGRLGDTVFISNVAGALRRIRGLDAGARLGFIVESVGDVELLWRLHGELGLALVAAPVLGVQLLGLDEFRRLVGEARRLGMEAAFWTLMEPRELRGLEDLADYVITDDPSAWRRVGITAPRPLAGPGEGVARAIGAEAG